MMSHSAAFIKSRCFKKKTTLDRFWSRVRKGGRDDCWEWTAYKHNGYGRINIFFECWTTHRLSWVIHNGDVPQGLFVLHKCDNPACVNPHHLFLGTIHDNVIDSVRKGRFHRNKAIGSRVGSSKFTERQVAKIRKIAATNRFNLSELARRYGVSQPTIANIVHRVWWKHV